MKARRKAIWPCVVKAIEKYKRKNRRAVRLYHQEYILRWRAANPERLAQRRLVARWLAAGEIERSPHCQHCGRVVRTVTTATPGQQPADIKWYCRKCQYWISQGLPVPVWPEPNKSKSF